MDNNFSRSLHLLCDSSSLCRVVPRRARQATVVWLTCLALSATAAAENWSRFRGPNGAGQSDDNQIPTTWQPTNYLWKQPLPGIGHSSPVIWNKQLFLTWADSSIGAQTVAAYDVATGTQLWQKQFEAPKYHINDLNSLASSTPAVDAEYLYVLWLKDGKVMLAALNHQGEERWRQEVGPFKEVHGFGISPIVVDDLVYVTRTSGTDSAITAFDRATGDVRWNLPQDSNTTAFSTPCLLDPTAQHKVLIATNTSSGLVAIDALTGKILWHGLKDDLDQRCVSSPIIGAGMILAGSGQGGNGKAIIAARPGNNDSPPQEVYRLKQNAPQVPTPVIADDLLFVWSDRGVVSCYDLATGKQHWRERIGGDFHSSPIRVGNRIFNFSRGGEVIVLAADKQYQLLARNDLGELCAATPAIANGRMFVRTESTLLCIGQPASN